MDGFNVDSAPARRRKQLIAMLAIATTSSLLLSGLNALVQILKVTIELAR